MNIDLNCKTVSGGLAVPASKSMMQRVCAAALLHQGQTIIHNCGVSDDDKSAVNIIRDLGASVHCTDSTMLVQSNGKVQPAEKICCGESGLAARLFTPLAALSSKPVTIDGRGSLLGRPMHFFTETLSFLGVSMPGFCGQVPFLVCGPLVPKNIRVDGSLSSQYISGLLFAFAATAREKVRIEVQGLVSKPYIDLTLDVLAHFGKRIDHLSYQTFEIDPHNFILKNEVEISIEGDWSSAAFWIAAAAVRGSVSLEGLEPGSKQADKKILEAIEKTGVVPEWEKNILTVRAGQLRAFDADLTDSPDLFPVLAVLAACCAGKSKLKGVHRLQYKESNRSESISALLSQLQVVFSIEENVLVIEGRSSFPAISYTVPNDHRMAMAAALASLRSEGPITIENAEAVNKSYPDFWKDISKHLQ